MEYQRILDEVVWKTALEPSRAEQAIAAALEVLATRLLPTDAAFLAQELPEPVAGYVRRREGGEAEFDRDELFRRVALKEGVAVEFAREHALAVCRAVSRQLTDSERYALQSRLPDDIAELLEPPEELHPPAPAHEPHARARTLATGRPGSSRPLSEASANRAQSQSVVASENPHADTKLSSAQGISTERQHRTIAEGKTGGSHPIAEDD